MKLTRHAKQQAQRRGIRSEALELIMEHGEDHGAGDGCQLYRIPRGQMKFIAAECPKALWKRYQDRIGKMALVVNESDQVVVTAMHRCAPIRNGWDGFKRTQR